MPHYAIVVDLNRCIGRHACEVSCKDAHNIDLGIYYNRVKQESPVGEFPHLQMYYLPMLCQQCDSAPCVEVCPVGASFRDENNVVLIDEEKCIGCQVCISACPYGARTYNEATNVVEKCTLCTDLTANGELPACVSACCASARFYGDLDDETSDAAQALSMADAADVWRLPDSGNGPQTAYILSARYATWNEDASTSLVESH